VLALTLAVGAFALAPPVAATTDRYLVKDINTSGHSHPDNLTPMGDKLYFRAKGGGKGMELWASDGTTAGTKRVKDIRPGSAGSHPGSITAIGGLLYFSADGGNGKGRELWRSDGTNAGTWALADINPGPGDSEPRQFGGFNGFAYFSADDGVSGRELWRSDGSVSGTSRVRDIASGPAGSNPGNFVTFAGKLVFVINSCPTSACFQTLYKSDGTSAGTKPFKDKDGQVVSGQISSLQVIGPRLFFILDETEIWRSNGGSSTLRSLGAFGPWAGLVGSGGDAYFNVASELWKSDGTTAGTIEVADLAGEGPLSDLFDVNGTLFFIANHTTLYKSDGTEAGTVEVDPGEVSVGPSTEMAAIGSTMYFTGTANDSGNCLEGDKDLWRSDGTPGGTFEVSPAPGTCLFRSLTVVDGALFFVADDDVYGIELWRYVP
jgi:ELWxxDGT repeat protein